MANATRKRRNLQPATSTSRWLQRPGTDTPARLEITAKRSNGEVVAEAYTVAANRQDGNLLGYRLTKADGSTSYDLTADLLTCDCPDYTHGRAHATTQALRLCKHCRGLAAALAALDR